MASNVSVTNTFSAATTAVSADVNENFSDLVTWINTNAVHLDGSKAFTAVPSGPASDPVSANQLARKAYVDAIIPAGVVMEFGGTAAPSGYLLCDGSAVSRATYATLFAVVGTAFGAGNGTTTFNLPDFRGYVSVGYKSSDADFDAVGKTGGQKTVAAHTHDIDHDHGSFTSAAGSSHTHTLGSHTHTFTTSSDGAHTHTQKVYSKYDAAAGVYDGLRPEDASGFVTRTLEGDSAGAHTHTGTTAAGSGTSGAEAAHTHAIDVPAFTGTSASGGSGTTNMNPFVVVNKIIKY